MAMTNHFGHLMIVMVYFWISISCFGGESRDRCPWLEVLQASNIALRRGSARCADPMLRDAARLHAARFAILFL